MNKGSSEKMGFFGNVSEKLTIHLPPIGNPCLEIFHLVHFAFEVLLPVFCQYFPLFSTFWHTKNESVDISKFWA